MKNYSRITFNGEFVPHKTVKGLKLAVKQGKQKDGTYKMYCPSGNIHTYEITSKIYVLKGRRTASKATVGKGINVKNPKAKLISVQ